MNTNNPNTALLLDTNTSWTLASLLVAYLEQLSIDYVFGVPGGAIEPLFNALAASERHNGPRVIIARHESGAAFMAEGYARHTGKLGICCATTGPGTTNLITGVASAYANQVPLLVISAQTRLETFGKGALQESSCTGVNTLAMLENCTRYNTLISHINQFERKLSTAIMCAFGPIPGPVHLSIPLDLMRSIAPTTAPSYQLQHLIKAPPLLDNEALNKLYNELKHSKKTVFVIGGGANGAMETILSCAEHLNVKLLTTPHGKGLVSAYHPNYRGVFGIAGHTSAAQALADPDLELIICIGTTLGEWATNGWDTKLLLNQRMVHVDVCQHNFTHSPMAKLHVQGCILTIFEQLLQRLQPRPKFPVKSISIRCLGPQNEVRLGGGQRSFGLEDEEAYLDNSSPICPPYLMQLLPKLFPTNTRYLADSGNSLMWAIHYLHPIVRHRRFCAHNTNGELFSASLDYASMGWAIGNAVGTAFARPGDPIVCITGDGSMLMSGQEITVAFQEKLPIIFVVLNDACLGMVKHGQRLARAETIGIDVPQTDFVAFAKSMGVRGFSIKSSLDMLDLDISEICNHKGPTLLDVHIDRDAIPPMATRMKVLQEAL